MTDSDLDVARVARTVKAFMDAVAVAAASSSPLLDRIQAHLGVELARLPVVAEEYDSFDHPNVQLALDAYVTHAGRAAEVVGVGAEYKRYYGIGLSDILSWTDRSTCRMACCSASSVTPLESPRVPRACALPAGH